MKQAMEAIRFELTERLKELQAEGRLLEAQRLEQRTNFDLEMIAATGSCAGIENYSRFLTGRLPGEPPPTLFEYLPENALLFVDESHQTVPQVGAMARGDHRRKLTLAEYGFRLPSCIDNRPLRFNEWDVMRPQTVAVSATPGPWELEQTSGVFVEQVIRPTGLIDPPVEIRPVEDQVDDLIVEARATAAKGYRTLVTTLTKRMAEDLTEFLHEAGLKVRYMHSDVETLERIELIRDLRLGVYDVLVGINLLREGLDIPECGLVAILDADKEGFLRSETSLIQTIGRASRNVEGRVILYADRVTGSMERALNETNRRRRSRRPTTPPTASPRPRSSATSPTSSRTSPTATASSSTPATTTRRTSSATICAAISTTSKSACARPPPTSNSRKPAACATRSAASKPTSSASPPSTSGRRCSAIRPRASRARARPATASRSRSGWGGGCGNPQHFLRSTKPREQRLDYI